MENIDKEIENIIKETNINNEEIPNNISGSFNYIMLGKIFSFFKWNVSPQIRLNIDFSQFSISFQKKFE